MSSLRRQVYADYESDPLLRQGIEFCCRQFYILHRKPFVLQLFASVAPLLEFTVRLHRASSMHAYFFCLYISVSDFFFSFLLSSDQHQYWSVERSVSPVSV